MRALVGGLPGHVLPEDPDLALRRREVARDEIEERGLAGAVGPEQQPPFSSRNTHRDIADGRQPAEEAIKSGDLQNRCRHRAGSLAMEGASAALSARGRLLKERTQRVMPGTRPSGMNKTITTKMTPSRISQRVM